MDSFWELGVKIIYFVSSNDTRNYPRWMDIVCHLAWIYWIDIKTYHFNKIALNPWTAKPLKQQPKGSTKKSTSQEVLFRTMKCPPSLLRHINTSRYVSLLPPSLQAHQQRHQTVQLGPRRQPRWSGKFVRPVNQSNRVPVRAWGPSWIFRFYFKKRGIERKHNCHSLDDPNTPSKHPFFFE